MDEESSRYAQLANAGYNGSEVDGYDIDRELSNRNRTVYVNRENGKATIAFSGTRLNSKKHRLGDIGTDVLLASGLHEMSARFRNAKKVGRQAIEKYGADNVNTASHSLGASQGLYLNQRLGIEAKAFSPGISPSFVKKSLFDRLTTTLFKKPVKSNATIYTTGKDPISILSPMMANAKTVFVKPKSKDTHGMINYLP